MPYIYPAAAPTISGDFETISRFLNTPTAVSRRLRTAVEQRYIADSLLSQRLRVEGGAVLYETGESIFTADNPRAISPGAEYPLVGVPTGAASIASTVKYGQDVPITDESIKRQGLPVVDRAFTKLANQNIKFVDGVALSAIATAVTQNTAAAAAWTSATGAQILKDVALAKANILALNQGYDPDTIVVSDLAWANAFAAFNSGGLLPREDGNPVVGGQFAVLAGLRWLTSPNIPASNTAIVLDSKMLGGMADEKLGGGYEEAASGVEVKSIRDELTDGWRLRARRVTVPVVLEPAAGWKITGLGA